MVETSTRSSVVDGFNLYHGLKDKYGRKFLWLDLEALCLRLLQPDQDLVEIKYFTAAVRNHRLRCVGSRSSGTRWRQAASPSSRMLSTERSHTALVVSADSDLCPAVRAVRRLRPDARVVAAFPPARRSDELRRAVHGSFTIARRKLEQSLLLDPVVAADGRTYPRPQRWK